jgi:HD-GYP domain-containing protein (c-di-GMP phosphodiesterase class II)
VKAHVKAGYKIVNTLEFKLPIAEIILQHHERLNGSGYPRGLSGGNILKDAKIIAIADVVEAMVSHRPYRPAMTIDKALDEIRQSRGILYDPEAVDACLRLFEEKHFVFKN